MTGAETITIRPFAKQREAFKACQDNRIVLYGGAIRGGKSHFLILYAFTMAFKYPKSRWLFLRENLPTLKRTLLVTFNEILSKGFSQYITDFNQTSLTVTLFNGSQFVFMAEGFDTDKDLNKFRGLEINGAFIDEANEIQEPTFNKVIERAGSWFHSPGCPTKIVLTANPSRNWLKEKIFDKWENGTLPEGMAYIPAKIFDNPHIPSDYLESLKMLPRFEYEVFVNGNWNIQIKTGGEFYKCFELDKHVGKCDYDPALPLHVSWDENSNPYLPCGIFQITIEEDENKKPTGRKLVRMIDEIAGRDPNNTISAVCREIKRRYPNHASGMAIYGDATANKQDTKLEKGYNFYRLIVDNLIQYRPSNRVPASNPAVAMRGAWINTILEKEISGISFLIDEKCKHAINDFVLTKEDSDMGKFKEMGADPKTKVRSQKVGHFTDLTDYFFCSAFAGEFIKYQKGGTETMPTLGKNYSKHKW